MRLIAIGCFLLLLGCDRSDQTGTESTSLPEDTQGLSSEKKVRATKEISGNEAAKVLRPKVFGQSQLELDYGKPFIYEITASNDPVAYAVTNQPPWLHRDGAQLHGHPSQSGRFKLLLRATNSAGTSDPFELNLIVGIPTKID